MLFSVLHTRSTPSSVLIYRRICAAPPKGPTGGRGLRVGGAGTPARARERCSLMPPKPPVRPV
jgi:hypothetical protein